EEFFCCVGVTRLLQDRDGLLQLRKVPRLRDRPEAREHEMSDRFAANEFHRRRRGVVGREEPMAERRQGGAFLHQGLVQLIRELLFRRPKVFRMRPAIGTGDVSSSTVTVPRRYGQLECAIDVAEDSYRWRLASTSVAHEADVALAVGDPPFDVVA